MRISRMKFRAFFEIFVSRPIRSAKVREFRELWRENVRARLGPLHLNWQVPLISSFRLAGMLCSDCCDLRDRRYIYVRGLG